MTIVTLVYVCPIFIVLMNSFKANTFVKTDTFAWPTGEALVGWANYIKGFTFYDFLIDLHCLFNQFFIFINKL